MTMLRVMEIVCCESDALAETMKAPAAVGVPLTMPVSEATERPAGSPEA
jgi:hypothetical protein